jgi:hypothetical protein
VSSGSARFIPRLSNARLGVPAKIWALAVLRPTCSAGEEACSPSPAATQRTVPPLSLMLQGSKSLSAVTGAVPFGTVISSGGTLLDKPTHKV